MNEFALECKYNCKYCSTKSSLPNLHENGITSLCMNLLWNVNINVSYDHVNLAKKIVLNNKYLLTIKHEISYAGITSVSKIFMQALPQYLKL